MPNDHTAKKSIEMYELAVKLRTAILYSIAQSLAAQFPPSEEPPRVALDTEAHRGNLGCRMCQSCVEIDKRIEQYRQLLPLTLHPSDREHVTDARGHQATARLCPRYQAMRGNWLAPWATRVVRETVDCSCVGSRLGAAFDSVPRHRSESVGGSRGRGDKQILECHAR
jgi:hypothetical protein